MKRSDRSILFGMNILIDHTWVENQAVVIEDKCIKAIIPAHRIKQYLPGKQYEFPHDHYLIPGLIDLHIHGIHGRDVMDGDEDALHAMTLALAKEGVTGFLATTMTADDAQIEKVLKTVAKRMVEQDGAAILGIHLEGPFIAPEKMGAQYGRTRHPDVALINRWQKIAQGSIKMVTLAPELSGALPFIKTLHEQGMILAAGHTNATYAETRAAITAGLTQATHLFNAMRGCHQREPGAAGALLLADEVMAELIVDGDHLHPAMVELALRLKGKERLLLVTDAMRATCLHDGEYELGGQTVSVRAGHAALPSGTLAGSTLRLSQAIKNIVQFTKCSLADAVNMATYNPARVLGLQRKKGVIAIGHDADMVVMNAACRVVLTMREGSIIWFES